MGTCVSVGVSHLKNTVAGFSGLSTNAIVDLRWFKRLNSNVFGMAGLCGLHV